MPTKWCISSDDKSNWMHYYRDEIGKDLRFYFLISRTRHGAVGTEDIRWDKIAIAVDIADYPNYYDLYDNAKTPTSGGGSIKEYIELPVNIQGIVDKIRDKLTWHKKPDNPDEVIINWDEELLIAARENDKEKMIEALKEGADIYIEDPDGNNALDIAISNDYKNIILILLNDLTIDNIPHRPYIENIIAKCSLDTIKTIETKYNIWELFNKEERLKLNFSSPEVKAHIMNWK
jgi:hypothetical protein